MFNAGSRLVVLGGALILGLVVYFGVVWLMKMPELKAIMTAFLRKFGRQ
jgi:hypothetical protein